MTYNVELVELTKASFKSRDPPSERSSDLIGPTQPAIADKQEEQVRDDLPKNVFFQTLPEKKKWEVVEPYLCDILLNVMNSELF